MGVLSVEYARGALCVILKHHGVIAFGKDLDQALEAAVYLEDAAKVYLLARAIGPVPLLDEKQIADQAEDRGNYGQRSKYRTRIREREKPGNRLAKSVKNSV